MLPPHRLGALLAQHLLHPFDRQAFVVKKKTDRPQQLDVLGPVIASSAAALERPDMRKSGLPKSQHVLRQVELLGDLADRAEGLWGLVLRRVRRFAAQLSASVGSPLMRAFSTLDGLNTITRRGRIGTSTPVFGLRPMR